MKPDAIKYRNARARERYRDMPPEKRERLLEALRDKRAARTETERERQLDRQRRANLSPEARARLNQRDRAAYKKLAAEKLARKNAAKCDYAKRKYAGMSDEQRARLSEANRLRYADLTPEQRERIAAQVRRWQAANPERVREMRRRAAARPENRERHTRDRFMRMAKVAAFDALIELIPGLDSLLNLEVLPNDHAIKAAVATLLGGGRA